MEQYATRSYQAQVDPSQGSAGVVVPLVVDLISPNSVVDVGCGVGTWLTTFKDNGVSKVKGVDSGDVSTARKIAPAEFSRVDFTENFLHGEQFDLVVCLDVAEHLDEIYAKDFVNQLCRLAPVVLFSAAIPNQGGIHRINEQWQSYWAQLFAGNHFSVVDCLRNHIWTNEDIAPYYAQNMFLYVDSNELSSYTKLAKLPVNQLPLDIVHPRLFERKMKYSLLRIVDSTLPESVRNRLVLKRHRASLLRKA